MGKINQRKSGVILSYMNLILGCIVPLLYTPIMLDILGQAEYGLYSLSNSIIGYLTLLNLGLGSVIVRYVARYRAENKMDEIRKLVGMFVAIYSVLSLIVCIVGAVLIINANTFFSEGLTDNEVVRLKVLMAVMTLSTAISIPFSVFSSIISAFERFVFSRLLAIFGTVMTPVLNLIVLYFGGASIGMALVGLGIQILTCLLYSVYSIKKIKVYPIFRKMPMNLLKEIFEFSAFVFLSAVVDMLYWATDKVLIGAQLGTVAVAIYNVGGVFTSMLQNMSQSISNVFTPKVTMMSVKKHSNSDVSELLIRIGRIQFYIVSFVLSGYIVFGQDFISFWAGKGYEDAYWIALLTMVPLSIPLIQSIAYSSCVAQNKHRFRAIVYAVIAVINVISTYLVIPYFGIIGAAVCTAVSFIVGNGIIMNAYYQINMKLDIWGFWKNIIRISLIPIIMIIGGLLIVNYVFNLTSMIGLFIGVLIYSLIFWIAEWFLSMNSYEKNLFGSILKKLLPIKGKYTG